MLYALPESLLFLAIAGSFVKGVVLEKVGKVALCAKRQALCSVRVRNWRLSTNKVLCSLLFGWRVAALLLLLHERKEERTPHVEALRYLLSEIFSCPFLPGANLLVRLL